MKRKRIYRNAFPPDYYCPLCPDHYDDEFEYNDILDAFICTGCAFDIAWLLQDEDEGKDCNLEYRKEELERMTGKTFAQLREIASMQQSILDDMIILRINGGGEE
jgi:hypothetical protein